MLFKHHDTFHPLNQVNLEMTDILLQPSGYISIIHAASVQEQQQAFLIASKQQQQRPPCSRTTLPTGLKIAAPAPQPAVEAAPNLPHVGIDCM